MTQRRLLVTGAGGFIGREVCRHFVDTGYETRALLGPSGAAMEAPPGVSVAAEAWLSDAGTLNGLLTGGVDTVVHLAGPPSVRASFADPIDYVLAHTSGTTAVLEAIRQNGVDRFIYVSSAEVYGRPRTDPVEESHPLEARSPYAAAKIGAEQMVHAYGHAYGTKCIILRPFSVYGNGMGKHALLPAILRQLDEEGPLLLADLRPERDYCHVSDVARAIVAAAQTDVHETVAVNVGSGIATSVRTLAETALRLAGSTRSVEAASAVERPGNSDIMRLVADRRRAFEFLNWEPLVTLQEGLAAMISARGVRR